MSRENSDLASRGIDSARDGVEEIQSVLIDPTENAVQRWVLLTGSRPAVAVLLLSAVFLFLIGVSFIRPYDMRDLLNETNAAKMLFSSLLSGAILLVSIVVSINSVVLSQEITDIESQEKRISATLDYRTRIEGFVEDGVAPARPGEFLPVILYAILERTQRLKRVTADSGNDRLHEQVAAFEEHVSADVDQARATLAKASSSGFRALLTGLSYNYSAQLYAVRAFEQQYADELNETEEETVDNLRETLTLFGTARGYFESLYFKQELAQLSSRLLFVSLPVIVFSSYVLLALDAKMFPEMTFLGLSPLLLFVSFAFSIALAPYVLLTAYVIRATTVTLRTLAAGPFILRSGNRIGSVDIRTANQALDWENLGLRNEDERSTRI